MDETQAPSSSMEASSTSNKSENESPTQATADKLSHLSVSSSRKISLESNGSSHQTASSPGTASTCYARSMRPNREILMPPVHDDYACNSTTTSWQLFSVTLNRAPDIGFGIGVSGGRDNPHFVTSTHSHYFAADPDVVVTDVIANGPAFGLIQVGDRVVAANGISLENADYSTAVALMKEAEQLNMIVKRRVPINYLEFEQRTLKFTLSKSRKKDDFGIVLGCKFYIKEITNPKLAEKEPGLKEGDHVLRINGTSLEGATLEEATRLLQKSHEKLLLIIQRDVRRGGGSGSRWPSQTTVYERLGSVSATPRHSPTPMNYSQTATSSDVGGPTTHMSRRPIDYSPNTKRFSDPSAAANYGNPSQFPVHHPHQQYNHGSAYGANYSNGALPRPFGPRAVSQTPSTCSSPRVYSSTPSHQPYIHQQQHIQQQNYAINQSPVPSHASSNQVLQRTYTHPKEHIVETARFKKQVPDASLGIRVIGGNHVGIFVSAVQSDSPASNNNIKIGDRLHEVNSKQMNGMTREEAVEHLLALGNDVVIRYERSIGEYENVKNNQIGDSFYIRTHFAYQRKANRIDLLFQPGDIFHVTDTLFNGAVGYWQATKVYSANDTEIKPNECTGIIPNSRTAETLSKQARMDSSTLGRSLFGKKLQSRRTKSLTSNIEDDFLNGVNGAAFDLPVPAYERVILRKPAFKRPVVLFGPLADVARQLLLSNFALYFDTIDENIIKMNSLNSIIDSNKHAILNVSPCSVERLVLSQYAPIVILLDLESRSRIRTLRSKAGATTRSARELLEQSAKIKKYHYHLLTATLEVKEESWLNELRMLIDHLQTRRIWIPEVAPANIQDLLLFPIQNCQTDGDADSLKADYGTVYDATKPTASEIKQLKERQQFNEPNSDQTTRGGTFASAFSRNAYGRNFNNNNNNNYEQSPNSVQRQQKYYDVEQILAEHYPAAYPPSDTEASHSQISSAQPYRQTSSVSTTPNGVRRNNISLTPNGNTEPLKTNGTQNEAHKNVPFIDDAKANSDTDKSKDLGVIETVHAVIDYNGGTLFCPESGVKLIIPPSAIPLGQRQEIFIKVCKENADEQKPPLDAQKKEVLLSPLIMCGPQGLKFSVPVELRLPNVVANGKGANQSGLLNDVTSFVLKSGSGDNWKNIELVQPPVRNPLGFVSVMVNHF